MLTIKFILRLLYFKMDSFSVSGSGQAMHRTLNVESASEGSDDGYDESMRDDSAAPDRVIFCADNHFFA